MTIDMTDWQNPEIPQRYLDDLLREFNAWIVDEAEVWLPLALEAWPEP